MSSAAASDRVAVVIPAYNAARWLGETLDSVAGQTVKVAEIIVVDDGSTDETAAIGKKHGAQVISTPNRGLSRARNTGMEAATADWIALLDADDLWKPDKLAKQLEAAALAPDVQFVASDHYQFRDDGGAIFQESLLALRPDRYAAVKPQRLGPRLTRLTNMGIGLIALGQAFFPSTMLFRRELAHALVGFDVDLRRCEDYEFLLRAGTRTDILLVEESLMGYRVHPTSLSRNERAMALAHLQIAHRMTERPDQYAPGVLEAYRPLLRERLLYAAALSIKLNEMSEARTMLKAAGEIRRDPAWLGLSIATRLPPAAISTLHRLKQRIGARA